MKYFSANVPKLNYNSTHLVCSYIDLLYNLSLNKIRFHKISQSKKSVRITNTNKAYTRKQQMRILNDNNHINNNAYNLKSLTFV